MNWLQTLIYIFWIPVIGICCIISGFGFWRLYKLKQQRVDALNYRRMSIIRDLVKTWIVLGFLFLSQAITYVLDKILPWDILLFVISLSFCIAGFIVANKILQRYTAKLMIQDIDSKIRALQRHCLKIVYQIDNDPEDIFPIMYATDAKSYQVCFASIRYPLQRYLEHAPLDTPIEISPLLFDRGKLPRLKVHLMQQSPKPAIAIIESINYLPPTEIDYIRKNYRLIESIHREFSKMYHARNYLGILEHSYEIGLLTSEGGIYEKANFHPDHKKTSTE